MKFDVYVGDDVSLLCLSGIWIVFHAQLPSRAFVISINVSSRTSFLLCNSINEEFRKIFTHDYAQEQIIRRNYRPR